MNEGITTFLAALQAVEQRDYGEFGEAEGSVTPFGKYGIWVQNWSSWSAAAGVGGHDKFDPAAQDFVASYWAQKLFQRYGDWDLVAAAWYAGASQTDIAVQSGKGIAWFQNPKTVEYLAQFKELKEAPAVKEVAARGLSKAARAWINPQGAPKGWLSPVAGESEYSNSFFVPRNNKSGIHGAIDIYAKRGTPIVAPVGGKILSVKYGDIGGYTVRMQGTDGLTYYFAHMDSQAVVKQGQTVQPGAHLGFVGNSGNARGTTPHLHFSTKKGSQAVNPYSFLQGARNAGNYYAPEDPQAQTAEAPSIRKKYTGFIDALSNQVAGGQRVDYRQIGLKEEDEVYETETGEVMT